MEVGLLFCGCGKEGVKICLYVLEQELHTAAHRPSSPWPILVQPPSSEWFLHLQRVFKKDQDYMWSAKPKILLSGPLQKTFASVDLGKIV